MDYLCSTLKTWRGYWTLRLKEYWGYQNFPGQYKKLDLMREYFGKTPIRLETEAISYWLSIYHSMADVRTDPRVLSSSYAKEGDEPWFSTGVGAIVIACASGLFSGVDLIGYDTTRLAGQIGKEARSSYRSAFRDATHKYPPHAWEVEAAMLPLLAQHYSIPVQHIGRVV